MKIGLLFGSFNPIHIAHLTLAEMTIESGLVDSVWFVVSPESPYKTGTGILAPAVDRYAMVQIAILNKKNMFVDDVEFSLPAPSYTYITLAELKKRHPDKEFFMICGTDVFVDIPNWIGGKEVIESCEFIVYPRETATNYIPSEMSDKVTFLNGVPSLEISATFLREQIKNNKTTNYLIIEPVQKYIRENNLYK